MAKGFAPGYRYWILAICILSGYGAVGYRLVELHTIRSPELAEEIERSRFRIYSLDPRRGEVFDSNGELLATSQSFLDVGVDPKEIHSDDLEKLPQLAEVLEVPLGTLREAFNRDRYLGKNTRWVSLKKQVEESTYERLEALDLHSVYGNRRYNRVYPGGEMSAHLLGYVRRDGIAVSGIEKEYDFYLAGQRGWRESEVSAGQEMAQFRRRLVGARDGHSVSLTIDSYVQSMIEEEIRWIVGKMNPVSASIIVSDPYTGFIVGLANYPTFDPNRYSDFDLASQKNRSLTDPLEPGSTFKIVAASGALEERLVHPGTTIDCSLETLKMPSGYVARLPKDSHPNGILSVEGVIEQSSNRGVAQLGAMLGEKGFYEYVKRFGFGDRTGFSLGQESKGILHPVNRWDGLTLTRMPMGHAIAATPLQIHFAMASVSNGGVLMKPQVVSDIVDANGETVVEFGPLARRRVISRATARQVAGMLEKAVSNGGLRNAVHIPGFHIAGKTGTSQKIVNGRYSHSEHVGSFSGFFPSHDPRLAITVIVDGAQVPGTAYGAKVAAPSFKNVAEKLIPYYAITPDPGQNESIAWLPSISSNNLSSN